MGIIQQDQSPFFEVVGVLLALFGLLTFFTPANGGALLLASGCYLLTYEYVDQVQEHVWETIWPSNGRH